MLSRPRFIAGCTALVGAAFVDAPFSAEAVPNSSAIEPPLLKAPAARVRLPSPHL
jgi:hypothetical protein